MRPVPFHWELFGVSSTNPIYLWPQTVHKVAALNSLWKRLPVLYLLHKQLHTHTLTIDRQTATTFIHKNVLHSFWCNIYRLDVTQPRKIESFLRTFWAACHPFSPRTDQPYITLCCYACVCVCVLLEPSSSNIGDSLVCVCFTCTGINSIAQ